MRRPSLHPVVTGVLPIESSSPLAALRSHAMFGHLPGQVLSGLIAEMRAVQFEEGAWISRRGQSAREMFLLIEGQALRERAGDVPMEQAVALGPLDLVGQEAAGLGVIPPVKRGLDIEKMAAVLPQASGPCRGACDLGGVA